MNELFLHYIWQYQFYDKKNLNTLSSEKVEVYYPGHHNDDQGPDFSLAKISIGEIEWYGNVEIHTKSSDWYRHHHEKDKAYDSIILHVVWENDIKVNREDTFPIPVLELKGRVPLSLIDNYKTFMDSGIHLPCSYYLEKLPSVYFYDKLQKVFYERLERKGSAVVEQNRLNANLWEETLWTLIVRNFGFKVNNEAFECLAKAMPYKYLAKHKDSLFQLEALLFGQSGLIEVVSEDEYLLKLQKEYAFLEKKYSLGNNRMEAHQWKFLRTRPYNFPTLRIAQLASFVFYFQEISRLYAANISLVELLEVTKFPVSSYWKSHYRFGVEANSSVIGVTEQLVYSIVVNAVAPYKVARYLEGLAPEFPMEIIGLMDKIPFEKNKITKMWLGMGLKLNTAFDSQASLELYTQYCLKRKCLYCSIGNKILSNTNGTISADTTGATFSDTH